MVGDKGVTLETAFGTCTDYYVLLARMYAEKVLPSRLDQRGKISSAFEHYVSTAVQRGDNSASLVCLLGEDGTLLIRLEAISLFIPLET